MKAEAAAADPELLPRLFSRLDGSTLSYSKPNLLYGIGTNLTNDVGLFPIKIVECNGKPLIKISDDEGKILCNDEEFKRQAIEYFKGKHLTD